MNGNLHRETGNYVRPFRPPCDPQRLLSPVRQGLRRPSALAPPSFYGAPAGNLGGGPECGVAGSGLRGATPSWSGIVSERRRASVASVPPSFPASPPPPFPLSPSFSLPCPSAAHHLPPSPYFSGCAPGASCPATHQTRSDVKARSDRLLHILQRRSSHHCNHSRQQRSLSPTRKGGVGARTSPVLRKGAPVSSANAPRLLPSSAWPGGSHPVLPGMSQQGSRSNEGEANSGSHKELLEVPVKGRGSLEGQYFPRNVVWGQPGRMEDGNRFVASGGSPIRTREGGIAGSRLGPFGAKHIILTKLIDNLELARRQLKPHREIEKNRVSASLSAVPPTAAPASDGETTAEREGGNETTEKEGSPIESSGCSQREGPSLVARSVELPVGVELRCNSRIVSADNAASSKLAVSGEEVVKDRSTFGVSGENEHAEYSSSSDSVNHANGERHERGDHRKQERKKATNQRGCDVSLSSSDGERSKAKANEKRHRRKSNSHGKEKGSVRRHRGEETLMSFDSLLSRRVSADFLRSASVAYAAPPLRRDKWADGPSIGSLHSSNFDVSERRAPRSENDLPDIEQAETAMAREWAALGRDKLSSLPSASRLHPSASGLFGEEIRKMGKNEKDMEQVILAREARTEDNMQVRKSARLDCLQQQELDLLDLIERRIKKQQEQNRKN
uniref:Uncharacterized protein n=1 Tax=Toxoplasma gondii COUG TaxID=1074873 RepID=A0A2G8Y1T6_TOXGO|nr:hypothetical protein TGCOUG_270975 [Toxoplasma gondii COUG]